MAARRGGLGPQGHRAIQEAAASHNAHRIHLAASGNLSNPAAEDVTKPDEQATKPEVFRSFEPSSRIIEAGYDSGSQRLYVMFVKPYGVGTPWTYEGVPSNVWSDMKRSASPGRFVNRRLNDFQYHRGTWV